MTISAEQARQEFLEQLRHSQDPSFVKLRSATQRLNGPDQEQVEKAISEFLTTDACFDAAQRQSGVNVFAPQVKATAQESTGALHLEITYWPGTLPPAVEEYLRKGTQLPPAPSAAAQAQLPLEPDEDAHG